MIDNDDGIPICTQIVHDTGQSFEIVRVQTDRRLIENIEHAGRPVADGSRELHPLTFTRRKCGSRTVKGQIAKSQIHQPLRNVHKGFADVFRHGTHLFRKRCRNPLHPWNQFRKRHACRLIQADAPKSWRAGRIREP